jgi:hypothetical protein
LSSAPSLKYQKIAISGRRNITTTSTERRRDNINAHFQKKLTQCHDDVYRAATASRQQTAVVMASSRENKMQTRERPGHLSNKRPIDEPIST